MSIDNTKNGPTQTAVGGGGLKAAIEAAIASDGPASAKEVLQRLTESQLETEKRISRTAVLIMSLFLFVEIIVQSKVGEIDVVGIKINDYSFLRKTVPVAICYEYMSLVSLYTHRRILMDAIETVFDRLYPNFSDAGVEYLIRQPSYLNIMINVSRRLNGSTKWTIYTCMAVSALLITIAPLLLVARVIYFNFKDYGYSDIYVVFTSIVSFAFFVAVYGIYASSERFLSYYNDSDDAKGK